MLVAALALGVVLASDVFILACRRRSPAVRHRDRPRRDRHRLTAAVAAAAGRDGPARARLDGHRVRPGGRARLGLPAARADQLLLGLVAVGAVAALPAVGALLVTSIFVAPAAIALLFARGVRGLLGGAAAIAVAQGVLGLYLSVWLDLPPGPAIAILGPPPTAA